MENTNTSEKKSNSKVFDDVFRTSLEKIPQLILPLINEIYGISYSKDVAIDQYRNEFYTLQGMKITDSNLKVADARYHFELQSTNDSHMHIRMLEYDTAVGIDNLIETDKELHMYYPRSCVLYLRGTYSRTSPQITIHYSDKGNILYKPSVLYVQNYSLEEMFQKHLILFLPFYIIRYEHDQLLLNDNPSRLQALLDEFSQLIQTLYYDPMVAESKEYFCYMVNMIQRVINYIFKGHEPIRKRLEDVIMRGNLLKLETDVIIENATNEGLARGLTEGRAEERENGIRIMISFAHKNNIPHQNLTEQLIQNYSLSPDQAEAYIHKYTQS